MDEGNNPLDASRATGARDWVVMIKDSIKQHAQSKNVVRPNPRKVMSRVRQDIRELKPKHYTAEEFSFGLFDRSPLDPLKTRADHCKVAMATAVLEVMGMTEDDWVDLCAMVVPNPKEIQDLYDDLEREPFSLREVQSVLTLDAIFLAGYLGPSCHGPFIRFFPSLRYAYDKWYSHSIETALLRDLCKVENQIPLYLIRNALLILVERAGLELDHAQRIQLVDNTLSKICDIFVVSVNHLLPGFDSEHPDAVTKGSRFGECDNFLDCLYGSMIHDMKQSQEGGSTLDIERLVPLSDSIIVECQEGDNAGQAKRVVLPSVTQLQKAGIEFHGRPGHFHDVQFKAGITKGILYLPTVTICEDTDMIWRNLVAHEDFHGNSRQDFKQYLHFMDKLIHSPNDVCFLLGSQQITSLPVMVLRSGSFPVIVNSRFETNEALAHVFNTMIQYLGQGPSYWI